MQQLRVLTFFLLILWISATHIVLSSGAAARPMIAFLGEKTLYSYYREVNLIIEISV